MKKRIAIAAIAVALMTGCIEKPEPPADIFSQEEMIEIIKDYYLLEATISTRGVKKPEGVKLFKELEKDLIAKHNLDTARYRMSYEYYLNDGQLMKEIFNEVKKELKTMKTIADKAATEDRNKRAMEQNRKHGDGK